MPCHHVSTSRGMAIVCTRGSRSPQPQRCVCCGGTRDIKLCDGPHPTQRNPQSTCDAPICRYHALHVEPDWDYCPRCATLPAIQAQHGLVATQAPSASPAAPVV